MITKKDFKDFIEAFKTFEDAIDRMEDSISGGKNSVCLWDSDWYEAVGKMLDVFLESHFTEEGCDIISWWIFEDVNHVIYQKIEDNDLFDSKKEIKIDINDIENLYDYLIKNGYTKS